MIFQLFCLHRFCPRYQSQITGITVQIVRGTPHRTFRLELKDGNELRWQHEIALDGGQQTVNINLPTLGNANQLVWVLDHASAGDYVVLDTVSFTATTQITDTATAAFAWSYGMLLHNWNPTTGLVRDKAKDASGEFDAIQATGSLAAATAAAEQLGVVSRADAIQVVNKISNTLLLDLPRLHGLWPHFVNASPTGAITIAPNTEWSAVDTVIAAIGLLSAQSGLGMDTSGTEHMLGAIDWADLVSSGGISHGYTYAGDLIPYSWDTFGGESWLVELAYAGVTGQVAAITYPTPPTANGSGFIDELAWVFATTSRWARLLGRRLAIVPIDGGRQANFILPDPCAEIVFYPAGFVWAVCRRSAIPVDGASRRHLSSFWRGRAVRIRQRWFDNPGRAGGRSALCGDDCVASPTSGDSNVGLADQLWAFFAPEQCRKPHVPSKLDL